MTEQVRQSVIDCTPVVLTLNEEANLARALRSVRWARRIVVVDSGSKDRTAEIAAQFPNVAWYVRPFDSHAEQWRFALGNTAIDTAYALALDADMAVSKELAAEIDDVVTKGEIGGGLLPIEYRIEGMRLMSSLCPAQLRLLRLDSGYVEDRGHAQSFVTRGSIRRLRGSLIHDDRKGLEAFVQAQLRYSAIEAPRVEGRSAKGSIRTFVRRNAPTSPLLAWLVAYVRAGGPLSGRAASRYATERLLYEALLRYRIDNSAIQRWRREKGGGEEDD